MDERRKPKMEGWIRLTIGAVLNACLLLLALPVGFTWSNYDRQFRLALLGGSLASIALTALLPVFWRGPAWQAPIAFILLWLPALSLYGALMLGLGR